VPVQADLAVDEQVQQLATSVQEALGPVNVLVHGAGEYDRGELQGTAVERLDQLYQTNVRAPYLLTQAILPGLKASRGQIVFINSSAGLNGAAELSQYAATKHALRALADSLRQEVNAAGVRVTSLYLGRTATPRIARLYAEQGWAYRPELLLQPEDVAAMVVSVLTLPRGAEVTDVHLRPAIKSY
jgi:NADP-dependent 3-hydroxy acid dehydrogenase YdfG